ncbi:MAG: MurNAc alpha-1-phosphate uridylyltransferase [Parvibaculaceae bacterium]|jgi:MurNAc alpha-1-phosphate uridylyltransferase
MTKTDLSPRTEPKKPEPIKKAMLMAAGFGTRMRPLTDTMPKPMVPFLGKPLIDHALDKLAAVGVEEVIVNVHYKADMLEEYLASRTTPRIIIANEREKILDTGGGLLKARSMLGEDPIFTFNSDSVWMEGQGAALQRLIDFWDPEKMDALLMIAPATNTIGEVRRGDFTMDADGRLTRRHELQVAPFMFAGVQIFNPKLLDGAPKGKDVFSTNIFWDQAIDTGRLFGLRMDGVWMHVGTPGDLTQAETFMKTAL